ncbi:DUF732 domain-containing protein [Mycobacterium sp. 852002-51961_SCH5331710]|uniref:DUF732 domain-containing protein n=1 Tax=Mycobacterium sp. 852002-51961_SCH5331710 TaxID=1834105 RepID=UPI0009ED195F|nr:DUF732 domain-containing protein [Mycobacterium sp. 852002-51961_SCH5331710]
MNASTRTKLGTSQRVLLYAAALTIASAISAPAAHADPTTDAFLNTLNNAGVSFSDPNAASSLGQTVCSVLKEPGSNFARAATKVNDSNTISPDMAALFTSIAVTTYCPSMFTQFANGGWLNQLGGLDG